MNKGFTLSEVLITLTIIGVVSALTLPAVIQKQRDKANVAKLQKVYSVLSQALLRAKEDQGDFTNWPAQNSTEGTETIFSFIEPYIKTVKKCGDTSGCWAQNTKSLSGSDAMWFTPRLTEVYNLVLSDGTSVIVDVLGERYTVLGLNSDVKQYSIIAFWVDVNGIKGPNIFGRDIFAFALANKWLVPFGYANNSANCNPNIKSTASGIDCAYKVLQEKAINY